ncbi:MAG TPA: Ig-like domain-containing protein, partial [Bacteroidales bacterium]|nr:Ig-like domain-containing protein [Bacteroidales bacterium]
MKKALLSLMTCGILMYFPAMADDFQVTTTSDSGPGSLGQAILNANGNAGADNIFFNIPGSDPNYTGGVWIITLEDNLPEITDAVTIDGLTQPGASAGNLMAGTPHTIKIEIRGLDVSDPMDWNKDGFWITSDGCTIRGLAVNRMNQYCISFVGSENNTVQTCHIGLNAAGLWADNSTNYGNGIYLEACGTTLIGGAGTGSGNVIAGTYQEAILADDDGTPLNGCQNLTIQGNIIGWNCTGQGGNEDFACNRAIDLNNTSQVLIGGTTLQERNVIANCGDNITFNYGDNVPSATPCTSISIRGNIIGADRTGTLAGFGSVNDKGIQMNTCTTVTISDNLISGNRYQQMYGEYCSGLTMTGNKVGTDISGMSSLIPAGYPSDKEGLYFDHLSNSTIGPDNLISGMTDGFGIVLLGSNYVMIRGNKIGTDILGNPVLGNAYGGIDLDYSNNITIGGRAVGDGNIIAGNQDHGVYLWYDSGNGYNNLIAGNSIFDNQGLGISLGGGRSENDINDSDNGANRLQNFPVITGITHSGLNTDITATLNSTPSASFTIDFYWSPNIYFNDDDYQSYGQGKVYLGSTSVTTDGSGNAGPFNFTAPGLIPDGWYVTATATDVSNNTSEFSDYYMFGAAANIHVVTNCYDDESNMVPGSLRQAILDANAHPGLDYIHFNIPASDAGYVASRDYWSIQPYSGLPIITDPVVIDGYTQPGAQPNTTCMPDNTDAQLKIEISGLQCSEMKRGFTLDNGGGINPLLENCVIRGLVINNWFYGGIATYGVTNSSIEGNYIGTDITGTLAAGGQWEGIEIKTNSSHITIGGTSPDKRNVISGNLGNGIYIDDGVDYITIQGNYIGTEKSGTLPLGNGDNGIYLYEFNDYCLIGGTTACSRNIISANGTDITGDLGRCGIFSDVDNFTYNTIIGNFIGTGATGTENLGNVHSGISLRDAISYNTIGGTSPGEGNVIVNNGWAGINLRDEDPTSICNRISGNSIFNNGMLGIDLDDHSYGNYEPGGVTENDLVDPDSGVNGFQNFPVLTTVVSNISSYTNVTGTINTNSNSNIVIEFFSNPGLDPTGNGEGQTYLGTTTVTTDGSGNALFDVSLPKGVTFGSYITTTATLVDGTCFSTSEFSDGFGAEIVPDTVYVYETNYTVEVYRDPEAIAYYWSISPDGPVLTPGTPPNDHIVSIDWSDAAPNTLYTLSVQVENECGISEASNRQFQLLQCDFGDAPDNLATIIYPTLLINDGANHGIVPNFSIGTTVDGESDGQPSANAGFSGIDGDDGLGTIPDDEDGVTFPTYLIPGQTQTITVVVNGAGGKLSAWIDWNANNNWADDGEHIAADVMDNGTGDGSPATGTIQFNVSVPADAVTGYTFARFRWSTKPNLTYTGFAPTGEVEDYRVEITSQADLVTLKTLASGDPTPNEGDIVTFTITVTNNGPAQANNVTLTDLIPDGLTPTVNNGTVTQGTYNSGNGVWTVGNLALSASATLTIEGTVNVGQGGNTITNTTTAATSDQPDPTTVGDDLEESVEVNDWPIANDDVNATDEDTPVSGTAQTNDTPSGDGGNVWTLVGEDGGALHGEVTMNPDGSYTYTPDPNYNGTDVFTYQVCDVDGDCDEATVTITIDPVDDQPVAVDDINTTDEDTPVSGTAQTNDTPS